MLRDSRVGSAALSLCFFLSWRAGMCARRRTYFLCVDKESRQRKRPLPRETLRCASGTLWCSPWAGSAQTRLRLKHAQPLIRPGLRSSARAEGAISGGQRCTREGKPDPALPCGRAEQRRGAGIRNSHVRRTRSGQVCEFPPRREQRKEPRSGPDFGSPFFWVLFFGEAKKSASAAGPRPGTPRKPKNPDKAQETKTKNIRVNPSLHPHERPPSAIADCARLPHRTPYNPDTRGASF